MPFPWNIRQKMVQDADGRSELSGDDENLHAMHFIHSRRSPDYENPNNGMVVTAKEHYIDHMETWLAERHVDDGGQTRIERDARNDKQAHYESAKRLAHSMSEKDIEELDRAGFPVKEQRNEAPSFFRWSD